jgi:uncharacterized protein with PIN domain
MKEKAIAYKTILYLFGEEFIICPQCGALILKEKAMDVELWVKPEKGKKYRKRKKFWACYNCWAEMGTHRSFDLREK